MSSKRPFIEFNTHVVPGLDRRYLPPDVINPVLHELVRKNSLEIIGYSVKNKPIYGFKIGSGTKKILLWSQMHGNESTTTRSMLDTIQFLNSQDALSTLLRTELTLLFIPQLNPDGAQMFTRVNSSEIDLNRDAEYRTQPESQVLRNVFDSFQPDFCFNLHDQRSIFGVGDSGVPATLSFLAPSANEIREITPSRSSAMKIIAGINFSFKEILPGGIGRFDDSFNKNCVGDQFQMHGVPTILFEAGHFALDYERKKTRELLFYSFLEAFYLIATDSYLQFTEQQYFNIPENQKNFTDIHVINFHHLTFKAASDSILKLQYNEVLHKGEVNFMPNPLDVTISSGQFAHQILDYLNKRDRDWLASQNHLSQYFE